MKSIGTKMNDRIKSVNHGDVKEIVSGCFFLNTVYMYFFLTLCRPLLPWLQL